MVHKWFRSCSFTAKSLLNIFFMDFKSRKTLGFMGTNSPNEEEVETSSTLGLSKDGALTSLIIQ